MALKSRNFIFFQCAVAREGLVLCLAALCQQMGVSLGKGVCSINQFIFGGGRKPTDKHGMLHHDLVPKLLI